MWQRPTFRRPMTIQNQQLSRKPPPTGFPESALNPRADGQVEQKSTEILQ